LFSMDTQMETLQSKSNNERCIMHEAYR